MTQSIVFQYLTVKYRVDSTMSAYVDSANVLKLTAMGEEILNYFDVPETETEQEANVFEWVFLWSEQPHIKRNFNE